jgi:hypothetical protein
MATLLALAGDADPHGAPGGDVSDESVHRIVGVVLDEIGGGGEEGDAFAVIGDPGKPTGAVAFPPTPALTRVVVAVSRSRTYTSAPGAPSPSKRFVA